MPSGEWGRGGGCGGGAICSYSIRPRLTPDSRTHGPALRELNVTFQSEWAESAATNLPAELRNAERQSCVPNDKCPFCWGVLSIGGGDGDKPRLRALIGHLLFMSRALLAVHFCPRNSVAAFLSSPARPSASLQKCDNPLRLPSTSIYYLYAGRFCLFKQEGHSWNNKSSRSSRCFFFFFVCWAACLCVSLCGWEKSKRQYNKILVIKSRILRKKKLRKYS